LAETFATKEDKRKRGEPKKAAEAAMAVPASQARIGDEA
jgi:hypothetical protein